MQEIRQKERSGDSRTKTWWIISAVAMIILGLFYYFQDPAISKFMPRCLLHTLTGLNCPGCGAQRMAHALLHGDLAGAWRANPFLVCMLPVIGFGIWGDLRPGRVRRVFYHPAFAWSLTISIILWGVIRNFLSI